MTLLQPAQKQEGRGVAPQSRESAVDRAPAATSGLAEKAPLCGKHLHKYQFSRQGTGLYDTRLP